MERCKNGTRRNKQSSNCETYPQSELRRCRNGTRRNKKTGDCEPYPQNNPRCKTRRNTIDCEEVTVQVPKPYDWFYNLGWFRRIREIPRTNLTPRSKNAAIIQRFMKKTKHKRIAAFLNAVCNDSGVCIAFGKEIKKIKAFFGNFSFDYIKDPIKRIGAVSVNGFVNELKFTHKGYSSYAILKSSARELSDNLMYEYRVGQFLNKMSLRFPCFVETYKLLKYPTTNSWELAQKTKVMEASVFKKNMVPQVYSLKEGCKSSIKVAVLIQHLKDVILMEDFIHSSKAAMNYDLIATLYQIYFVLDCMKDVFTHYDLHDQNVLLYEPSKKKYIKYHYHTPTKVIIFRSIYLAKIIDYGRSYFKDGTNSSKKVYTEVCAEPECNTLNSGTCGSRRGFRLLKPRDTTSYLISSVPNKSHDLRLVYMLLRKIGNQVLSPTINGFVKEVKSNLKYDGNFGTKERTCALPTICDVTDMKNVLERYVVNLLESEFFRYYPRRTKLGDMHVYSDGRPLEFIES